MKRFIAFLLSFVMVFTLPISAFASNEVEAIPDINSFVGETFYYNEQTGEILSENGKPFAFEDVEFKLPAKHLSEDGISPNADSFDAYIVRGGLKRTTNGQFTWWFNVDCPTSPISKPNIKLTAQLKGNFTNGSGYSNVGSAASHTYTTNEDYGIDYVWKTTAKTGYYYIHYTLVDYESNKVFNI